MKHQYHYEYKNVALKPLSEEDIENLRIWRNDESNCEFLRKLPFITEEMQLGWFRKYENDPDEMCFSIYETVRLRRMVGSLSLYDVHETRAEFGKILIGDREAHGKGIGLAALTAVLHIAFFELKLSEVILHVFSANIPALTVYRKAGFTAVDSHPADGREELTMSIGKAEYIKRMEEQNA